SRPSLGGAALRPDRRDGRALRGPARALVGDAAADLFGRMDAARRRRRAHSPALGGAGGRPDTERAGLVARAAAPAGVPAASRRRRDGLVRGRGALLLRHADPARLGGAWARSSPVRRRALAGPSHRGAALPAGGVPAPSPRVCRRGRRGPWDRGHATLGRRAPGVGPPRARAALARARSAAGTHGRAVVRPAPADGGAAPALRWRRRLARGG